MKKFLALNTALLIGLSTLLPVHNASASTLSNLETKKSQIQKEKNGVSSEIKTTGDKLGALANDQEGVLEKLNKITATINETATKIDKQKQSIIDTKQEIETLKEEIIVIQDRIDKRTDLLKERARTYQVIGELNYLEVLLGAGSFGDLIERVGAVTKIMNADNLIIEEQEADKKEVEKKQAQVEEKLATIVKDLKNLENLQADLVSQKKEQDKLKAQIEEQQKVVEEEKMSLEEEADLLAKQQASIQLAIKQEQARLKEEAAAAAAAKRASAKSQVKGQSSSSGSSNATSDSSSSSSNATSVPSSGGGMFIKPSAGYLSSGFQGRWGKFHYGIDYAASGKQAIVASAGGVVTNSHMSSSYGNVIYLTHSINGKIYTTVYAHLSSRLVSNGQTVSQGQLIGYMGNTGQSTGQHLHFEIHEGPWNAAKSNAVDPRKYVN